MKKLMRLLTMTLAAAMLLSVGALAAGNENGGPRLVWNWLDWDEEGRCYVRDDVLSGRDYGAEGEITMAPGDEQWGICFTISDDGRRTPVVPRASGSVTVETPNKDEIAPGAKQSQYYVRVRMDDWKDGELTSGKSMLKVKAELPDVGLYTTATATQSSYLRNDQQPYDPTTLKDNTVYLVRTVSDDPNQRQVMDVKKNGHGNSNMYDLEKVSDNVWKITLNFEEGGMGINLDVSFRETDGNTYTEERGWGFEYPQGPELWLRWLDWNSEVGLFVPDEAEAYPGFQPHPGDESNLIFYTCDYDDKGEQTLTPVLPKDLKGSAGVTITDISDQSTDKLAKYFVCVEVADWEKEYTITSGEYTMRFDSNLPEIGPYSKPEATVANYLQPWKYSPTINNTVVYLVSTATDENNGRHLESMALSKNGEDNGSFSLEKVSSDVYKLTLKTIEGGREHIVRVDVTWRDAGGETYTDPEWEFWAEAYTSTIASEKPITGVQTIEDSVPYNDVKSLLTDSLTMKAGETKTVYLGGTYCPRGEWVAMAYYRESFYTSDAALKITPASEDDLTQYTLSCDVPGVYELGISPVDFTILDASGKDISDEFDHYVDYDAEKGWYAADYDEATGTFVPADVDVTITGKPVGAEQGWPPITVTVTGEAGASTGNTGTASFPDVAANAWYAPAVAFASSNGYMSGNANGTFNPDGQIKGSEFAQILYNKEGKPAASAGATFSGVTDQWFAPAILWAAGEGIVTDTGDTDLSPEASLTRQQIALMLYNYMGKPEADADLSRFADADKISSWAKDAMEWAVSAGVLNGSESGGVLSLNPTGTAKRSETAQILMNFFG